MYKTELFAPGAAPLWGLPVQGEMEKVKADLTQLKHSGEGRQSAATNNLEKQAKKAEHQY